MGGSQGAKRINETIAELAEKKLNKKYQILLSCGGKQYEPLKIALKEKGLDIENLDGIKVKPYIYEMAEIMNASDILVCRSGATTITEITKLGKPAIFIPLPNVSHDHQMYNAKVLENINAAEIIKNDDLDAESLNNTIEKMLDKDNLKMMGENARRIAIDDAEDRIYNEIKTILK